MSIDMSQARTASNPGTDAAPAQEKSLGELLGDLTRESSNLIRQEVNLAKVEIKDKMSVLAKDVVKIAAGGALAYAGLIVLLIGIGHLLDLLMPTWLAFTLVGAIVAGVGGFLAMSAVNALKQADLAPHQTVETLKEDAQWAKQQIR